MPLMLSRCLLFALLLLSGCHSSSGPPPGPTDQYLTALPDPKSLGETYVSDPDRVLQPATVADLNRQLRALDQSGRAHIDVVLAKSIGQVVPKTAATTLLNRWKVGAKGQNNGLLMLLVLDQRRIELEIGYGLEADLPDIICFRITQKMLPFARAGRYDEAVTTGLAALVGQLNGTATPEAAPDQLPVPDPTEDIAADGRKQWPPGVVVGLFFAAFFSMALVVLIWSLAPNRNRLVPVLALALLPLALLWAVVGLHLDVPGGTVLAFCYLLPLGYLHGEMLGINRRYGTLPATRSRLQRYHLLKKEHRHLGFGAFVFPVGLAFYWLWHRRRLRLLREAPYACPNCAAAMHRLSEQQEDAFLAPGQVAEEQVRSADYDVWQCPQCPHTLTLQYKALSTEARPCPQCKFLTLVCQDDTVEKVATTAASGWGWHKFHCANCHHEEQKKYTIARIRNPSSSSSSSSSSGSSSSSDSYSSSDGGSSGGGGRRQQLVAPARALPPARPSEQGILRHLLRALPPPTLRQNGPWGLPKAPRPHRCCLTLLSTTARNRAHSPGNPSYWQLQRSTQGLLPLLILLIAWNPQRPLPFPCTRRGRFSSSRCCSARWRAARCWFRTCEALAGLRRPGRPWGAASPIPCWPYLMACGDSRGLAMGLLGGLGPFACFAWQVPDRNAFPAKSIRKPLTICLLISALLLLMLLRLLSGLLLYPTKNLSLAPLSHSIGFWSFQWHFWPENIR